MVTLTIDGITVDAPSGATILEACDRAGRYVPRLCSAPGSSLCTRCCFGEASAGVVAPDPDAALSDAPGPSAPGSDTAGPPACGLCVVRRAGSDTVLACATIAEAGAEITTDDPGLRALRLERLAPFLARHPHICLTCPDRDGCARDECRFGVPPDARCCDESGRCEFGKLVGHVDPEERVARRAVAAPRGATVESRIRREPGLCLGCWRCVAICSTSPDAGDALEMRLEQARGVSAPGPARPVSAPGPADTVSAPGPAGTASGLGPVPGPSGVTAGVVSAWVSTPRRETLRESGCTFCGQCVVVCPAGAITAVPGVEGQTWLDGRRKKYGRLAPVLPPVPWILLDETALSAVPRSAGVFQLAGADGRLLQVSGCADLRQGLAEVFAASAAGGADATAASVPETTQASKAAQAGQTARSGQTAKTSERAEVRFRFEVAPLYTERESELLALYAQEHGHLPPGNDLSDDLFDVDLLGADPFDDRLT